MLQSLKQYIYNSVSAVKTHYGTRPLFAFTVSFVAPGLQDEVHVQVLLLRCFVSFIPTECDALLKEWQLLEYTRRIQKLVSGMQWSR